MAAGASWSQLELPGAIRGQRKLTAASWSALKHLQEEVRGKLQHSEQQPEQQEAGSDNTQADWVIVCSWWGNKQRQEVEVAQEQAGERLQNKTGSS